jgi:hypothetical protein
VIVVDDATLDAMDRFGGSFVKQLAKLYRVADPDNQGRLRLAFADVFAEYAAIWLGKGR